MQMYSHFLPDLQDILCLCPNLAFLNKTWCPCFFYEHAPALPEINTCLWLRYVPFNEGWKFLLTSIFEHHNWNMVNDCSAQEGNGKPSLQHLAQVAGCNPTSSSSQKVVSVEYIPGSALTNTHQKWYLSLSARISHPGPEALLGYMQLIILRAVLG